MKNNDGTVAAGGREAAHTIEPACFKGAALRARRHWSAPVDQPKESKYPFSLRLALKITSVLLYNTVQDLTFSIVCGPSEDQAPPGGPVAAVSREYTS